MFNKFNRYFNSNAPRIPPRRAWKIGGLEAWRLGSLEAWKLGKTQQFGVWKSGPRASKMEPQGLQNGAPGPPKWSPGLPKRGPGPPKWVQVGPESIRMVIWRSLGTPREPSRPLGSGLGGPRAAKMGAKGTQDSPKAPKMVPKWGQNGVQNRSKMGSDSECSKMSISDRFLDQFSIKKQV